MNFTNPIDIFGQLAVIQVDDNTSTNTDVSNISGVIRDRAIGGGGVLAKTGTGTLYLTGANTYTGNTFLNTGNLVITSFGGSLSASSSLGGPGGSLNIGNGGNTVNLMYVGAGEVSDRLINITSTTGTVTIDSSGTGAVVLTSVTNIGNGSKTLELRGTNTGDNIIASALTNGPGGALAVQKQDAGTWILGGDSTYTGTTTVSTGLLGLTMNNLLTGAPHAAGTSSIGTGILLISNGGIFGADGPLTITNTVQFNGNANYGFNGSNPITIANGVTGTNNGGNYIVQNDLNPGVTLTINGAGGSSSGAAFTPLDTANRTLTLEGTGNTVFNGTITNPSSGTLLVSIATGGTVTLGGTAANTWTGATSINQGNVVLAKVGAISSSSAITMSGGFISSTLALTGTSALGSQFTMNNLPTVFDGTNAIELHGLVINSGSTRVLENDDSGGLTISGNLELSEAAGTGRQLDITGSQNILISGQILNAPSGTTASSLQYSGAAAGASPTLTLTASNTYTGNTVAVSGTIDLTGAGTLATGSTLSGTTFNNIGITVDPTATLMLDNSTTAGTARLGNNVVIMNGGTLALVSGATAAAETDTLPIEIANVTSNITMTGAGGTTLTFNQIALVSSGSMILLDGITGLGTTNKILATNTVPVSTSLGGTGSAVVNGIIDRVVVNGTDFGAYNSTSGLVAFTGYTTSLTGNPITSNVKLMPFREPHGGPDREIADHQCQRDADGQQRGRKSAGSQ